MRLKKYTSRWSPYSVTLSAFIVLFGLLASAITPTGITQSAHAANAGDFNPGHIISDSVFFNGSAMSANAVQSFLNAKVPICTINNGDPTHATGYSIHNSTIAANCLRDFSQTTPTVTAPGLCSPYQGAANESAATIIAKVGAACGVSQKVLLVLLEKEQSLVTDTWPNNRQFNSATGFACYDNNQPCVQTYSGFFYQVWAAAQQFQRYGTGSFTWYPVGQVSNIRYQAANTEAYYGVSCGTKPVYIQNRATAALYYYTPYTPNAAALNNLYGTGDSCSAYGNRNFWRMFTDWFGSATEQRPLGSWDLVSGDGGVTVRGWAMYPADAHALETVPVAVSIDGTRTNISANKSSPEQASLYPLGGSSHGFEETIAATVGLHQVCLHYSYRAGGEDLRGCLTVNVTAPPTGVWSSSVGDGGVTVSGWAVDPGNTTRTVRIRVTVDGVATEALADQPSAEASQQFPSAGANHGYSFTAPATPGSHQVCLYHVHASAGATLRGCLTQSVTVAPDGAWQSVTGGVNSIQVKGWVVYPGYLSESATVSVSVDGVRTEVTANQNVVGSEAAYPGAGNSHGYDISIPASPGVRKACLYHVHRTTGETLRGCLNVTVAAPAPPTGAWDTSSGAGGNVSVSGWAINPADLNSSTSVVVTVDGARTVTAANKTSSGSLVKYPSGGNSHGYSVSIPASVGSHRVCVYYATSNGATEYLQGCLTQVVAAPLQTDGAWDTSSGVGGKVSVSGWAINPADLNSSTSVVVTVDGARTVTAANKTSSGSLVKYPSGGNSHGYSVSIPASVGSHRVCVYYATSNGATEYLQGCLTQVVAAPLQTDGVWETATGGVNSVQVKGWVVYPGYLSEAASVSISVDGVRTAVTANQNVVGSEAVYLGAGNSHGYDISVPASPGVRRVCLYHVHRTTGETLRGCLNVTVQ